MIAFDPGKCTGYAVLSAENQRLLECGALDFDKTCHSAFMLRLNRLLAIWHEHAELLVMEYPQVYTNEKQKGRQIDVVELAFIDGLIASYRGRIWRIFPAQWKGQRTKRTKDVQASATRKALTEAEIEVLSRDLQPYKKSLQHNIMDAVGIGLWAAGRML